MDTPTSIPLPDDLAGAYLAAQDAAMTGRPPLLPLLARHAEAACFGTEADLRRTWDDFVQAALAGG